MAAGALAFSVMSAIAKLVGSRLPLFELVFGRSLVMLALAAFALRRQGRSFRATEPRLLVHRGLFGFASLVCYFYSVVHLPLADATVIFFLNPVITALVAAVVLREHLGWAEVLLVAVSLSGVVVVARPEFLFGSPRSLDSLAVAAGLLAATFGAGSYVTIRKIQNDPPLLVVLYFSGITCMLSFPFVLRAPVMPSAADVVLLIVMGVATHVGQLWVTWGFRTERAGRASAVGYLQIVFAAFWGWMFFAEVPDAWTWIGAGIIVGSTLKMVRIHPIR